MLEQYGTGAWRPVPARRDLIFLAYPRAAGAVAAIVAPPIAAGAAGRTVGDAPGLRPGGYVCDYVGAPQDLCSFCGKKWCTRCYASQCACVAEVERRAASADSMSGVMDLCSPDSSSPIAARSPHPVLSCNTLSYVRKSRA